MVKFTLEERRFSPEAEPKAPLSSSLMASMAEELAMAADALKRDKALIIRASLHRMFSLDPAVLDEYLMTYYQAIWPGPAKPFTTTLTQSQKDRLAELAGALHRPKADLVRAALHRFLNQTAPDQEREVLEYLEL